MSTSPTAIPAHYRLMRLLILSRFYPERSPSQRFRFEQYLPVLRSAGIECDHSFVLDPAADRAFYGVGGVFNKARLAMRARRQRLRETTRSALAPYDAVFVAREALFFGGPTIERRIKRAGVPLIYDFDDALWMNVGVSRANRWFRFLKRPDKIPEILRMADLVIAGNSFLAEFATRSGAARVEVVPTTADTDEYRPVPWDQRPDPEAANRPVCIGWSGSFSTVPHFETALPALKRIRQRFGERVTFRVVGDGSYRCEALDIRGIPWTRDTEIDNLRGMDIGIMPLPGDEWSKGKCGLKGLLYMAMELPTLMSPVGVNTTIIDDGTNGFLPATEDEWVARLSELIESAALRRQLGEAGRRTVLERYSKASQAERYVSLIRSVAGSGAAG